MGPAFLSLFVLVTEIGNLWLAKIELRNAAEAGALAGAKAWGDNADSSAVRSAARLAAQAFAEANTITGVTISVNANDDGAGGNLVCPGDVLLGRFTGSTLDASPAALAGPVPASERGVRVHASALVPGLWNKINGSFPIQVAATARYVGSEGSGEPAAVSITALMCN